MTIINGIEIDNIKYEKNSIRDAIRNNEKIEDKLHIIMVISNPCLYKIRYILSKEFITRMEQDEKDVILYIVELAYEGQDFALTEKDNKRHLQIKTNICPLWHKENMINMGVKYLLPENWKCFAWIDGDIDFENETWASDTLKILNGHSDVVQIFSHAIDMDINNQGMNVFNSLSYQYVKNNKYIGTGINFSHPGFAWAMTRKMYENIGGLYEDAILGSGDNIMAFSFIGKGLKSISEKSSEGYKNSVNNYQNLCKGFRLGYVPGVIRHFFHGSKKNRKYCERWEILIKSNYDPYIHLNRNNIGLIIPSIFFNDELKNDILNYFKERNEDEDFEKRS